MLLTATSLIHNLEYEPVELRECINSMILLVDQDCDNIVLLEKMLKLLENFGRFNLSHKYACITMERISSLYMCIIPFHYTYLCHSI